MFLKGFETLWSEQKIYNPADLFCLSFTDESFQKQYADFRQKIYDSIGKKYLPIYRMADGEFNFCLQKYSLKKKVLSLINKKNSLLGTCWGENYAAKEIKTAQNILKDTLRTIAASGYLAIHFMEEKNKTGYADYIKPICDWFDRNNIILNKDNYVCFYYIYALLTSKDNNYLFNNKNILIITHSDNDKKDKVNLYLKNRCAKSIEYYDISPDKSMFDIIDFSKIKIKPDLILVGAGIGSANILCQLQELNTVCIDVGIVIEYMANASLPKRLFIN